MWRSSEGEAPSTSVPAMSISPPAIFAPRRWWASSEVAAVVLPEADSPTRPSTSPLWMANVTSSSMSMPDGSRTMRRSSTVRTMSSVCACAVEGVALICRPR